MRGAAVIARGSPRGRCGVSLSADTRRLAPAAGSARARPPAAAIFATWLLGRAGLPPLAECPWRCRAGYM